MNNDINDKFLIYLKKWVVNTYGDEHGGQIQAAKFLGIAPSTLNNILAKRRKCSEKKKHEIAKKIGISYSKLIDINDEDDKLNDRNIGKTEQVHMMQRRGHPDEENLLEMTRKILSSGTEYAESLAANIRSFHHAVENKALIKGLISRVENLEEQIKSDRRKFNDPSKIPNGVDRRKSKKI